MFRITTPTGHIEWSAEAGFSGDPVLVALVQRRVDDGDTVAPTPTGPFYVASATDPDAAYATAVVVVDILRTLMGETRPPITEGDVTPATIEPGAVS